MKKKISKEKIVMAITIGIASLALMLVMFMQFKVVEQTDITGIENMRESDLRVELADWQTKYEELNERYQEVVAKMEEYQNEKESGEETAKLLETELAQLNMILGKTDVEGEGIEVTLRETDNEEISQIIDIMLKEVQNRLAAQKIKVEIEPEVKELIASKGVDKAFGARPLRRTIQSILEDKLAEEILDGNLKKNKLTKIGVKDGKIVAIC